MKAVVELFINKIRRKGGPFPLYCDCFTAYVPILPAKAKNYEWQQIVLEELKGIKLLCTPLVLKF